MQLLKNRFLQGVLAFLLVLSLATLVRAAGTTVSVGAAPLTVKKGEVVAVPVKIAEVSGLYGFEAQLKFDPSVVRVADADPAKVGVQLLPGDFLALDFLVRNTADNDAGTAEFVLAQLNPSVAQSGSGTLFTVYFEGVAEGSTTSITLDRLKLASRDGSEIPATAVNGEIAVAAAPSVPAAASPTPLPTAAKPVLDMDVLTATPAPTPLPVVTEPVTVTPVPAATTPATPRVEATGAAPATATLAVVASLPAATSITTAAATQPVTEQSETRATATSVMVAAVTPSGGAAATASAPILDGTLQGSAAETAVAVAPVDTGLLIAGGALIALAIVALAVVLVLRIRARRP